MSFLPENYEKPASNSKYLKLQDGDNKFRILSDAITGYVDWEEKKPIRTKTKPEKSIDPTKPFKHFWAFVVWDYKDSAIKILEVTQSTIQDSIINLHSSEEWGDPKEYDIKINRTGEKMETKYKVIPIPPKELDPKIKALYKGTFIDLNKLYTGEDPFDNRETVEEQIIDQIPF